jgi:hypothetical protein
MPEGGSPELLDTKLDVHDLRQFELKLDYQPSGLDPDSEYLVEAYFFIPKSLNIDVETWSREQFYSDLHNYVRLKTPVLSFDEILTGTHSPLVQLEERKMLGLMGPESELIYDAKMLTCIFRAALRRFVRGVRERCSVKAQGKDAENSAPASPEQLAALARKSVSATNQLLQRYRAITAALCSKYEVSARGQTALRMVDEYMSLTTEQYFRRAVVIMDPMPHTPEWDLLRKEMMDLVITDETYRKEKHFRSLLSLKGDNEEYLHRLSFLKKFCANILFLKVQRESPRRAWEELLFAMAAGGSMAFALGVGLFAQSRYPQASFNFFMIAVMGYMLKDRIKEGLRRLLAMYVGKFLYERNTRILDPVTKEDVGLCREKVDYGEACKVPEDIAALRAGDDIVNAAQGELGESVIRYRKRISLESDMLPRMGGGIVSGVTDIIRVNVDRLLRDMDDPEYAIEYVDLDDFTIEKVRASKSYRVDLAFRFAVDDGDYRRTVLRLVRLILDRNGIKRMVELAPEQVSRHAMK